MLKMSCHSRLKMTISNFRLLDKIDAKMFVRVPASWTNWKCPLSFPAKTMFALLYRDILRNICTLKFKTAGRNMATVAEIWRRRYRSQI